MNLGMVIRVAEVLLRLVSSFATFGKWPKKKIERKEKEPVEDELIDS